MKKYQLTSLPAYLLVVLISLTSLKTKADETPVVLREWAAFAGNTDSTFVVPVLSDGDYTYSATYKAGMPNGVDIVLTKYDKDGHNVWQIFWTGSGVGRDQPSDMVMDEDFIYLSGITYSSANNYDFLTIQISKTNGSIGWVKTFNSSFSNYDVATSIGIFNNALYVTGVSYQQATLADYHTIKYNLSGDLIWQRDFDYGSLMDIPFDLSISLDDTTIIITGASQSNLTDWDYQTVIYDSTGAILSQPRTSGSTAGFDRASAVKTDENGFIYITGATRGGNGDLDIKTVKLYPNGNLVWADTYDSGGDDMGNDLLVDKSGNVYICGESHGNDKDFFIRKYKSTQNTLWTVSIDGAGYEDIAYKMCFDADSNIIVTGKGFNPQTYNYDFLTVAFKPNGGEMWRDYFDGPDHGSDEARNIVADSSGNIFVTGQVERNGEFPTVTIKYRTDFFSSPPAVDSPAVAYLFYPNEGQLIDTNDSLITDSVHYYTNFTNPQLFFGYGVMNMVFAKIDLDTSTTDTIQRVDVSFLNATNLSEAFPIDEFDSTYFLNYYSPQCANGILHVNGNKAILFTDIYEGIDAKYTSNNSGLVLSFIVNPYSSNPGEIGLKFEGQNSVSVQNNFELKLSAFNDQVLFQKPKVYQIDTSSNIVNLPWNLTWTIQNGNEAILIGWGSYDGSLPLIVDIRQANTVLPVMPGNADWGTCLGTSATDEIIDNCVDIYHNYFVCGRTYGSAFPGIIGTSVGQTLSGSVDAFATKFNVNQEIVWSTYYGGITPSNPFGGSYWPDDEAAYGMCATKDGDVLLVGETTDSDFPLPSSASGYFQNYLAGEPDGFIVQLNGLNGSRLWATLYGGITKENIHSIIQPIDEDYFIVVGSVSGLCEDINHPGWPTPNKILVRNSCVPNPNPANMFDNGIALCNSSGGYFDNIAFNGGTFPLFERKGFISKFDLQTKDLLQSTFFGGDEISYLQDIAYHNGKISVLGRTSPTSSSTTCSVPTAAQMPLCDIGGYFQTASSNSSSSDQNSGIIAEFDAGFNLIWSTLFGSCDNVMTTHLAYNSTGNLYVTGCIESANNVLGTQCSGATNSCEFPLCQPNSNSFFRDHYDNTNNINVDVNRDFFITRFDNSRNIAWSTFLGGSGEDYNHLRLYSEENADIAIDKSDRVFLFGTSRNITGNVNGDIDLNNPAGQGCYFDDVNTSTSSSKRDAYLAVFGEDNHLYWSTYIGGGGQEWGTGICTDFLSLTNKSYLYVAGNVEDVAPIGIITGSDLLSSSAFVHPSNGSYTDGFIWRFDLTALTISSEEVTSNRNLLIYPNPTADKFTIAFPLSDQLELKITNPFGAVVLTEKLKSYNDKHQIDVSKLCSGIYFVTLKATNIKYSGKLIIQK